MDSANREEALKALSIARRHLAASPPNLPTAKRLALKSVALCETSEAVELLERIRKLEEESNDDANSNSKTPGSSTATANGSAKHGPSTHASGAEPFAGSEGIKHRTAKHSSTVDSSSSNTSSARDKGKGRDDEKRDYTPDQLAVVQRIRKCKVTEYYEIMSLKKDCEDADIKKAYRKVRSVAHGGCHHWLII
jgi:DnaJ family protein B protein 12